MLFSLTAWLWLLVSISWCSQREWTRRQAMGNGIDDGFDGAPLACQSARLVVAVRRANGVASGRDAAVRADVDHELARGFAQVVVRR